MWLRLMLAFVAAGAIAECGFWLAGHSGDLVSPEVFSPCASRFAPRWGWNEFHSTVPSAKTRRILFVGNSLTLVNDLPGMLVKVASADPSAPVSLETRSITGSDVSLERLWDEGCGPNRMATDHFDVVILQEQSFFWDTDLSQSREAAGRWFSAARTSGAMPLYFQPWTGPPIRGDGRFEESEMEQATHQIAGMYGAPLIRIGEAFNAGQTAPGAPDLFQLDRHHASEAGTWLAALVILHTLTGEPSANSRWRPPGVSPEQAAIIQRIADQFG